MPCFRMPAEEGSTSVMPCLHGFKLLFEEFTKGPHPLRHQSHHWFLSFLPVCAKSYRFSGLQIWHILSDAQIPIFLAKSRLKDSVWREVTGDWAGCGWLYIRCALSTAVEQWARYSKECF